MPVAEWLAMPTHRILPHLVVAVGLALGCGASDAAPRHLSFNGHAATAHDLTIVAQLERGSGQSVPDGDYWYDNISGGAGRWGGPAEAILPAGLGLGGPLPANASGGGTGVFINGRELHPIDVQRLIAIFGFVHPGRFWVDASGNAGYEGGPALINLYQAAQQARGVANGGRYLGGARGPDGACGGHMGPYATIRRGDEVAAFCRNQGHTVGQTYHNGDGYYIGVR
jgi:hypothetical protein